MKDIKRLISIVVVLMIMTGILASCSVIEGVVTGDRAEGYKFDIFSYDMPEGYKISYASSDGLLINLKKKDVDQDENNESQIETEIGLYAYDEEGLIEGGFDPDNPDTFRETLEENGYNFVTIADREVAISKMETDGECYQYDANILEDRKMYGFWMLKVDTVNQDLQVAPLTEEDMATFESFLETIKRVDETDAPD